MKKALFMASLLVLMAGPARADLVEEEPDLSDNTGPLGVASESTTSVDIITDEDANGTKEGEITLKHVSGVGVEIYSGHAKVEAIPEGSDGWTGSFQVGSSDIKYTPAGRPRLTCPSQSLSGWYGPCKIDGPVSE